MQESELYEELLGIDAKLSIALKNDPNQVNKPKIQIIGLGDIQEETLDKIFTISKAREAEVKLLAVGVLEISFKEEKVG